MKFSSVLVLISVDFHRRKAIASDRQHHLFRRVLPA
jgi:hypothetical protein